MFVEPFDYKPCTQYLIADAGRQIAACEIETARADAMGSKIGVFEGQATIITSGCGQRAK